MNKYMIKKLIKKIIVIVVLIVGIYYGKCYYDQNIKKVFKPDEYKTAIEINNSSSDFMLLINQKDKVTDIIYLNENSVKALEKNHIEDRNIPDAIELVVNKLSSNDDFISDNNIIITNYGDINTYNRIAGELSKDLVVYAIDNSIEKRDNTIENKVRELNLSVGDNIGNLWSLYNYSNELKKNYGNS